MDWKRIELDFCSFYAPSDLVNVPVLGINSAIWKFTGKDFVLTIDLGLYSGKSPIDREELEYSEKTSRTDGLKTTLVRFRVREDKAEGFNYVSVLYSPIRGSRHDKVSFAVLGKTPEQQKTAEKIFRTIKFKRLRT